MARPTINRTQRKPIDGALQGGSAQRPFTWCVLDRLLGEHSLVMAGSSGTSAGAMQAVALAASLLPLTSESPADCRLKAHGSALGRRSRSALFREFLG